MIVPQDSHIGSNSSGELTSSHYPMGNIAGKFRNSLTSLSGLGIGSLGYAEGRPSCLLGLQKSQIANWPRVTPRG